MSKVVKGSRQGARAGALSIFLLACGCEAEPAPSKVSESCHRHMS